MNKRYLLIFGALALVSLLFTGCTSTVTTTVRTTQATTMTQPTTVTQTAAVVPTTITVQTGVFPGGFDFGAVGGGTYILPNGSTTVLRPTGASLTINATVTAAIGTYTTVTVLSGIPPVIPHAATVDGFYGFCFNCHQMPAGHVGRIANQDLCRDCHQQGPIILAP